MTSQRPGVPFPAEAAGGGARPALGGSGGAPTPQPSLRRGVCLGPEYVTAACGMVAEMVESLPSVLSLGHRRNSSMPAFLTAALRNIVVSLARLPLVNSYTRVPPLVSLAVPLQRPNREGHRQPSPGPGVPGGRGVTARPPPRGGRVPCAAPSGFLRHAVQPRF